MKMSSRWYLKEECRALDESREFISWFQRHFPTVPSEVIVAFEANTITGEDFLDMEERDFKEIFPRLAHRKVVRGIYNCVNGSVSDPISIGLAKVPVIDVSKPSTSQSDFLSDEESEASSQSTLTLLSSSSGDGKSDDSFSSQDKRTSTPIPKQVSTRPVSVQDKPKAHLPSGFVIPSKFGKVTDGNMKSGNITDVDRTKVVKTVATCVWVYTDSPSPGCCEWLAKQLIAKYPILADADPRKMLNREQAVPVPKEDFKYWYSLKKAIMKKFENWRYRENKRSPDFLEQKAKKKRKTEEEDLDSDPAAMERNIKRLQEEQSKSRNQDASVLWNLLSVTFGTRHQQLLEVSDGKSRVSKFLKDWPILGKEIYFKEEVARALSKAKVPINDFSAIVDNWKKVIPNLMHMLGDVCTQDDIPTVNFVSDEEKFRILSKFVFDKDAHDAIYNDATLDEEEVEVLPSEWKLEDDELPLVPHLKKYFPERAWLKVEDGLKCLKQQANTGNEIKALLSLTKLFPGLKKLKNTGSDFVVNVAENGKSVTEFLKKPPSTSPYLIISKRGSGWQTFLACGGNSVLEATTISTGVAALIGSYFLFNFEYPSEAKGAFLFLQEYLLNDFVNQRHSKYAAALVQYQTAAMKKSNSPMASLQSMEVPE